MDLRGLKSYRIKKFKRFFRFIKPVSFSNRRRTRTFLLTSFFINKKRLTIKIVSLVSAKGFEPLTVCLEGRCSIQLSYAPLKF